MIPGFTSLEMALAAGLVMLSAGLSLVLKLGIHLALSLAALRMVVQLLLVGLLLRAIFSSGSPWLTLGLLVIMIGAASYEVGARQRRRLRQGWTFLVSGAAVSSATLFVAAFALASLSGSQNWTAPAVVIPIAGIILGSAMNAASIGIGSLLDTISAEKAGIEARLALGHSMRQATEPLLRRAIHAGTIPLVNQMAGAGLITLPGIMSGQVLAGFDPLAAAQSQIFLMFLLSAASVGCVVIAVFLTLRRLSDERQRLRLDRLEPARL
ncbi:MAG: ABC transporter permease [Devosia sp.]|nr:ABC transporter permease [Devosia sp.]